MRKFIIDLVRLHNEYRSKHNAPPIVFSPKISQDSQCHAEKLAKIEYLEFSECNYGENLWARTCCQTDCRVLAKKIIDRW